MPFASSAIRCAASADASTENFVARVDAAAQREDEGDPVGIPLIPTGYWVNGNDIVVRCTRMSGKARQLNWPAVASSLSILRQGGGGRGPALERYGLPARYSLVVSIQTQQTDVDLYTAVAQKIPVANAVVVNT